MEAVRGLVLTAEKPVHRVHKRLQKNEHKTIIFYAFFTNFKIILKISTYCGC